MTSSEERLRAVTVGRLQRLNGPVVLRDYDGAWPAAYECEAVRIRSALGDAALVVEHVGSTSVQGLAAKPVIDILLVVADSSDEGAYLAALEGAGYRVHIREPGWFEHRLCKGPDTDINLHIFSDGCPEVARMLTFRDRLRSHPDDRHLYEATKRDLAARHWAHLQDYADAKAAVVAEVLTRAEAGRRGESAGPATSSG